MKGALCYGKWNYEIRRGYGVSEHWQKHTIHSSKQQRNKRLQKLYSGYNITVVSARRAINCNGNGKGSVTELVIRNYQWKLRKIEYKLSDDFCAAFV